MPGVPRCLVRVTAEQGQNDGGTTVPEASPAGLFRDVAQRSDVPPRASRRPSFRRIPAEFRTAPERIDGTLVARLDASSAGVVPQRFAPVGTALRARDCYSWHSPTRAGVGQLAQTYACEGWRGQEKGKQRATGPDLRV